MPLFLVAAGLVLHWRGFTIAINRPEPQVQGGDDEQVEHRRGDQATQDDNGHRLRYFLAWDVAEDHQGYESQPRCQRGHQDRREPLSRPSQDEFETEWIAFVLFEMLVMLDQHDAVARRYPEHSEQSGERSERDSVAGRERRQHSPHQGRWQGEEDHSCQAPGPEGRLQEEEDPERGGDPEDEQAFQGGLLILVFPQHL